MGAGLSGWARTSRAWEGPAQAVPREYHAELPEQSRNACPGRIPRAAVRGGIGGPEGEGGSRVR